LSFTLTFEVNSAEILETISNNELIKVRMLIAESGINRHNMIISSKAIKQSAFTFVGKPILAKFDDVRKDAMGHEPTQSPVGVCALTFTDIEVIESAETTRLYTIGYMWKRYCSNITNIFEKEGSRPISMEILVTESFKDKDGRLNIEAFCGTGTTILGMDRNPAIYNANAQKVNFESMLIDMSNTVGVAIPKDDWGTNPKISILSKLSSRPEDPDRIALMNKILKANNYNSLINACYLVKETGWQENPVKSLQLPICSIVNNEFLLYNRELCEDALSILEKNKTIAFYKTAKNKLLQIYEKLGIEEKPTNIEQEGEKMDEETIVNTEVKDETLVTNAEEILNTDVPQKSEFEIDNEKLKLRIAELEAELFELKDAKIQLGDMQAKFEVEKSLNAELISFKEVTLKNERNYEIERVLDEVSEDLSASQLEELRLKADTYEKVVDFSNAVKAFAHDISKGKNKSTLPPRISIPLNNSQKEKNSDVWDRLNN
jgi:hypothetical protein